MSQDKAALSLVRMQFRLAATDLCVRSPSAKAEYEEQKVRATFKKCLSEGLRPRYHHLTVKVTSHEKDLLSRKAQDANKSLNRYIRSCVFNGQSIPWADMSVREHLFSIQHQLNEQGRALNRVASHFNGGILNPNSADHVLSDIARSIVLTHKQLRQFLSEGRRKP